MVLSQAGQMSVVMADTLMVGQLGEVPLASVAFAGNLMVVVLFLGIGVAYGVTPLAGKSWGEGNRMQLGHWLAQTRGLNHLVGIALTLLMGVIYFLMPYMGQPIEVVETAKPYFLVLACSMWPSQIFAGHKQFAEGVSNTRVAMVVTVLGNVLNVIFDYLLMFGLGNWQGFGFIGGAYGTLISKVFMAMGMAWAIRNLSVFRFYHVEALKQRFSWRSIQKLLVVGLPIGGQMVIEVIGFSAGAILMGWIGTTELAAHQIVMTLVSFTYMMATGVAAATTIKVSVFRGSRQWIQLRHSAWASVQLVLIFMGCLGVVFVLLRHWIPQLFISEPAVLLVTAQLLLVGGAFQLFDGLQLVSLAILRGLEDVLYPTLVSGIAYFVTSLPVGYLLAFVFNLGPIGVWIGYLFGLAMASVLLVFRFRLRLSRLPLTDEHLEKIN